MDRAVRISHLIHNYAGAALYLTLIGTFLFFLPRLDSLLAHTDQMAENGVKASGVVANASAQEATQVYHLTRQLQAEAWHADRVMLTASKDLNQTTATLNAQIAHLGPVLDATKDEVVALKGTTDAAQTATQALTVTLNGLSDPTTGLPRVLRGATEDEAAFRDRLNDPNVARFMANLADATGEAKGVTADAHLVANHYERAIDHPTHVPWYIKLSPSLVQEMWRLGEAHAAAQ